MIAILRLLVRIFLCGARVTWRAIRAVFRGLGVVGRAVAGAWARFGGRRRSEAPPVMLILRGAAAEAYMMTWRKIAVYTFVFALIGLVCVVVYSVCWVKWWLYGYGFCVWMITKPWRDLADAGLLLPTFQERVRCLSGKITTSG